MTEHHNTLIIGAGLSGLYAAWQLQQTDTDFIVLDARKRTGGRILSVEYAQTARFDMGPAWLWPDFQPRLQNLVSHLNVNIFKQHTEGQMLYETASGDMQRHGGPSSHEQSFRIADGGQSLIEALQAEIPVSCIHLDTCVQSIRQHGMSVQATRKGEACQYSADSIILALPPRLITQNIDFTPPFPAQVTKAWNAIPTWMAGHCKMIFIYQTPFWREIGLSGEVFSQRGPLSEIFDASPQTVNEVDEEVFALTAFVGTPARERIQAGQDRLIEAALVQLQRLFGDAAGNVLEIKFKDWAEDNNTCSERDLAGPAQHPQYPDNLPRSFWNKSLILAGTEVARQFGGYLEGALESADEAIALTYPPLPQN